MNVTKACDWLYYVEAQWIFLLIIFMEKVNKYAGLLIQAHHLPILVHSLVTVNCWKGQVLAVVSGKRQRDLNLKRICYFVIYLLGFLMKILEENILW